MKCSLSITGCAAEADKCRFQSEYLVSLMFWFSSCDPNVSLLHIFFLMSCSVLESDPEFGFEQAKRQLEGSKVFLFSLSLSDFHVSFSFLFKGPILLEMTVAYLFRLESTSSWRARYRLSILFMALTKLQRYSPVLKNVSSFKTKFQDP